MHSSSMPARLLVAKSLLADAELPHLLTGLNCNVDVRMARAGWAD